jgi:hypothetical protein
MPVEIKEMVIRANITNCNNNNNNRPDSRSGQTNNVSQQSPLIVEQCVEQVLDIIRRERER